MRFGCTVQPSSFWIMTRMESLLKKWIPELVDRTNAEIACSDKYSIDGYSSPIVDLSIRSREMKSKVFEIRKSVTGKKITQKSWRNMDQKNPFQKEKEKVKQIIK